MDSRELSRRVIGRRKELGMSQADLAEAAHISRNYVSLIERGEAQNVSTKLLSRLALALGTTPSQLSGESDEEDRVIPNALRQFGLAAGLPYEVVDRLSRIPARGQEPRTADGWRNLYEAIRLYLEGHT